MGETFRSVAAEIDELIETRGQKTVEYAENMDNSIQEVYRKISEHSDLFVNEAEKIIAQTALVEDNISSQANELKNIADTVAESLRSAEDSLIPVLTTLTSAAPKRLKICEKWSIR